MSTEEQKRTEPDGLYRKFRVERVDGRDKPGGDRDKAKYFVLDYAQDPYAPAAILAYADACEAEEPGLAADLRRAVAEAPPGVPDTPEPDVELVARAIRAATDTELDDCLEDEDACFENKIHLGSSIDGVVRTVYATPEQIGRVAVVALAHRLRPSEPLRVPGRTLEVIGLTDDEIDPNEALQFGVRVPHPDLGHLIHVYGDQSWVAYGTCIEDGTHPDGRIFYRTVEITYGEWRDAYVDALNEQKDRP